MRVLIAPDRFKGSLTAAEVTDHLAKGLDEAGAHSRTLPLADGGDGSVAAAVASGFHPLSVEVRGPQARTSGQSSPSTTTTQ
jgi:glycerate 2-kinase